MLVPHLVFPKFKSLFTIIGCRKSKNLLKDTFIHKCLSAKVDNNPKKVLVAFSQYCGYGWMSVLWEEYWGERCLTSCPGDQDTAAPLASQQPTVVTRRPVPGVISSAATSIPTTARYTHAGMGQHRDIPSILSFSSILTSIQVWIIVESKVGKSFKFRR